MYRAVSAHKETHFTGSETVRDLVIGMSDGLTVPFALAAGLSGAVASGHVVLIASVAAFRGLPDSPAYCASKAGLWAYGESLRPYLGPRGVRLTNVAPGFFESAMSARFSGTHPLKLSGEAAAERIASAVAAGRGRCIFPRRLGWTLRLLELLPAPLADRAARLFRFTIAP